MICLLSVVLISIIYGQAIVVEASRRKNAKVPLEEKYFRIHARLDRRFA